MVAAPVPVQNRCMNDAPPDPPPTKSEPLPPPNRLAYLRKKRGLTQEQLAAALGVKVNSVTKWENRHTGINGKRQRQLSALLEIDPASLFGEGPIQRKVVVEYAAEAGVFVDRPQLDDDEQWTTLLIEDADTEGRPLTAAEVRDDHASRRYPKGSIVFVMPIYADGNIVRHGARYLVERETRQGVECSIRRLENSGGEDWYVAEHPAIAGFRARGEADERITVTGRIVHAHVKEPPA